jgi:hypothetical protein
LAVAATSEKEVHLAFASNGNCAAGWLDHTK